MPTVSVWKCAEHGEIELIDWRESLAHCPKCGKVMEKTGEYNE